MGTLTSYLLVITATCLVQQPEQGDHDSVTIVPATKSTRWEGKDYAPAEAATVLLDCIQDSKTSATRRGDALNRLGNLGKFLYGHDRLGELTPVYARLETLEEKGGILLCFVKSEDPRGLALFKDVLGRDEDPVLHLFAAGGLAEWNVRSGVEKLIALLSSDVPLPSGRSLGEEAAIILQFRNERNRWGVPEKDFGDAIRNDPTISSADYVRHYQQKWLDWLERNPQRFNDWKLGDPPPPHPQSKTQRP